MSRPIAAIEVNEIPDGGPAVPVELTTDAPEGGPALPVVRVAAGSRAQVAIAPVRMRLVTSGARARTGRRPVPIVVVAGDTTVPPVVPPSPLLTDLAARWSMDEAAGNRLDSGANLLHLAPTGIPTQEIGKLASAVGTSAGNYLSRAGDDAALRLRLGMTIACWVYATATVGYQFIAAKDQAGGRDWSLAIADGQAYSDLFSETAFVSLIGGTILANAWYHLVVRLALDGTATLFINAASIPALILAGVVSGAATPLHVGRRSFVGAEGSLTGRADELTIWHRALTDPEIAQLYNGGAGLAWPYI